MKQNCSNKIAMIMESMTVILLLQAILLLLYGSIVTPLYEEIVFRGYIWNRLNTVLSKEIHTYIWSIALFTVWHLGYMLPQIMSGNWRAVLWKLAVGFGYKR